MYFTGLFLHFVYNDEKSKLELELRCRAVQRDKSQTLKS